MSELKVCQACHVLRSCQAGEIVKTKEAILANAIRGFKNMIAGEILPEMTYESACNERFGEIEACFKTLRDRNKLKTILYKEIL